MKTAKLKKTLATIGTPAKKIFHAVKNAVLTNKRVDAKKSAIKLEHYAMSNSTINAEKTVLFNQIIGITQDFKFQKNFRRLLMASNFYFNRHQNL